MSQEITKTVLNKEIQAIQSELSAPNLGTDKQFININGSNLIFESNTNSTLNYKLPNPIKLDVGDKVTLYQAFVNESGLNQDTITFQEDVYEELSFLILIIVKFTPILQFLQLHKTNIIQGIKVQTP